MAGPYTPAVVFRQLVDYGQGCLGFFADLPSALYLGWRLRRPPHRATEP